MSYQALLRNIWGSCWETLTVFPLISIPGAYLILMLWGVVLKEGDAYFKIGEIIHMMFQSSLIFILFSKQQ